MGIKRYHTCEAPRTMPGTNSIHISKKKMKTYSLFLISLLCKSYCFGGGWLFFGVCVCVFLTGLAAMIPNLGMDSLFT